METLSHSATPPPDTDNDGFDAPPRSAPTQPSDSNGEPLLIDIDGYAGPLHLLLDLARSQKVDLRRISILALVDQYLAFVDAAKTRRLELAADYLVMAAWLTYLKSRLLLPVAAQPGEERSADEMAARLAFRLQRLEAMRKAAETLLKSPQYGVDFVARGAPQGLRVVRRTEWRADLYDLLKAYTRQRIGAVDTTFRVEPPKVFSIEEARLRLRRLLGDIPDWIDLMSLTPGRNIDAPAASVTASAFNAALEFAKEGAIEIRQLAPFQPVYIRARVPRATTPEATNDPQ